MVDLPEPEGPTKAVVVPCLIFKFIPFRTCVSLYANFTSVKAISNPFKFLCWSGRSKSGSDKIELISPTMVLILEKSSVKKIADTNGPTIPSDKIIIVMKAAVVRLPFI